LSLYCDALDSGLLALIHYVGSCVMLKGTLLTWAILVGVVWIHKPLHRCLQCPQQPVGSPI